MKMRDLLDLMEEYTTVLPVSNPRGIDPALMTYKEFEHLIDPDGKNHPGTAYQVDVKTLTRYTKVQDFTKLYRRILIRGLRFEIRMQSRENQYTKKDDDGEHVRDINGQLVFQSPEEIAANGLNTHEHRIAIFTQEGEAVASLSDEWGCVLIQVAKEYQGFGLGIILGKIARTMTPDKPSGGFTPGGRKNFQKAYREIVRDALVSGRYRALVKSGAITPDRAKTIITSAGLQDKLRANTGVDLTSSDPKDWLLYSGGHGDFILYDRKLREILDDTRQDSFADKMIKAMVYVETGETYGRIKVLGGDSSKLKSLMMRMALQFSMGEGTPLVVEVEDIPFLPPQTEHTDPSNDAGYDSVVVNKIPFQPIDLTPMIEEERRWRHRFDKYDEFLHQMMERSYSKFG
jgi:hypothetical protein